MVQWLTVQCCTNNDVSYNYDITPDSWNGLLNGFLKYHIAIFHAMLIMITLKFIFRKYLLIIHIKHDSKNYFIETLKFYYNIKRIEAYHRRSKAYASFFQELAFLQQNRHFLSNEDRLLASWILGFCLGPLPSKMTSILDW